MASLDSLIGYTTENPSSAAAAASAPASSSSSSSSSAPSQFLTTLFGQLVQTTRQANSLPDADDFKYLTHSSPEFVQTVGGVQKQLLNLLGLISDTITHKAESSREHNQKNGPASSSSALPKSTAYSSKHDSLDQFHLLNDCIDSALENVDLCLDAHRGVKRGNTALMAGAIDPRQTRAPSQFQSSIHMLKPQKAFAHLIDNSTRPWIPLLTHKPNAMKPLLNYEKLRSDLEQQRATAATSKKANVDEMDMDESSSSTAAAASSGDTLSTAMSSHIASLGGSGDLKSLSSSSASSAFPHPYKYEIENMDFQAIRATQLSTCKEQLFDPLSKVPCTWIDTLDALEELADALDCVTEIAVDLEHHSMRSYYGITCLMQISTRRADYLIDTLALRSELYRLNSSFTNPAIVKVLHGADSDIIWLQRDFGLYIVNLFDTGQAARVMEYASAGLAHLLQRFCDVHADKKYQLADWRVRPLSAEMLLYARMDTHYLLYMYDRLKNALIGKSTPAQNAQSLIPGVSFHLSDVIERSRNISLRTYEKDAISSASNNANNSPMEFAGKHGISLHNENQTRVLFQLFKLRDDIARADDESTHFICSNANLASILTSLPMDAQQLNGVCRPVPPLVKQHAAQILHIIHEAKSAQSSTSLTSPFLASTLPPSTFSPAMGGATGGGYGMQGIEAGHTQLDLGGLSSHSLQTPQKYGGGASMLSSSSGLPPIHSMMTPASVASAMFAQLATSTPQHVSNAGWIPQTLNDSTSLRHPHPHSHTPHQPQQQQLSGGHPSPVLSTDQLYSGANWVLQVSSNFERSLSSSRHPFSAQQQALQLSAASGGSLMAVPMFDESGVAEQANQQQQQQQPSGSPTRTPFTATMSPSPKSSFSMLTPSAMSTTKDSSFTSASAAAIAAAQADIMSTAIFPLITQSALSTPLKSAPPHPSLASSDSGMYDEDDNAKLRTPDTGEPTHSFVSPSPMSLMVAPSPVTIPHPNPFASIAADFQAATVPAAAASTTGSSNSSTAGGTGSSPLPKSMREIYKISNDNRRKKKKSKTSHPSTTGAADVDDIDESHSGTVSGGGGGGGGSTGHSRSSSSQGTSRPKEKEKDNKKGGEGATEGGNSSNSGSHTHPQDFLKNIGWVTSSSPTTTTAAMQLLNNTALQQPNSANAIDKKRKHSSAPASGNISVSSSPPSSSPRLQPFNYSSASLTPTLPSSVGHFDPHADMGRDRFELKAAANVGGGPTPMSQKVFKGHTQLKSMNKNVTVRMDERDTHTRQRGGSAGSGLPPTALPAPRGGHQGGGGGQRR